MRTAAPQDLGFSPDRLERIDAIMNRYVDADQIAGTIPVIARRGEIVYARCFGHAVVETETPMAFDTLFRIYSMTKPITSLAVLMLYEEGRFHLTDPVSRFLPEFARPKVWVGMSPAGPRLADAESEIAIWHLLTHTAGLSYGNPQGDPVHRLYSEHVMPLRDDRSLPLSQLVAAIAAQPLAFHPGTQWRYGMATDVLGYLVEVVSGQPFAEFLDERILQPLGMRDTSFAVPDAKLGRFSAIYGPKEGGGMSVVDDPLTSRWRQPTAQPSGGGGLVSTAPDYMRFCQMLLNGGALDGVRLLGRKTVELMTVDHLGGRMHPFDDPARGFGLGVDVLNDVAAARRPGSLGAFGWGGAANTTIWMDPQEELIGLLLLQYMPEHTYPVIADFRAAVYQALV